MIYSAVILLLLFVATGSFVYPLLGLVAITATHQIAGMWRDVLPVHIATRFTLWHDFWSGFPSAEWWDRSSQTANAFFALNAGGLGGTGLGLGNPNLVPLVQSDFVFVATAEELGFIGTLGIFLLYLNIILTGVRIAFSCSSRFEFLAVSALAIMFCCQIFINIGGVLNIIPLIGVVLPFLSKGEFAFITFSIMIGFIIAVSHKNATEHNRMTKI